MNFFKRFFGHLRTVNRHRRMVRRLCFKCGLYWQGLTHDLSKYSPVEFWNGVKYYTGTHSPHIEERATRGYSEAWLHHKGRNKHHAEYWQDICEDGETHPITMHERYFVEMICDRVAASMIYLGDKYTDYSPLEYYDSHIDENQFNDMTRYQLVRCLNIIACNGFDSFAKKARDVLQTVKNINRNERKKRKKK